MAKNKAHSYLYDEWESLKTALREEKANLHALDKRYKELHKKHGKYNRQNKKFS